MNLKKGKTVNTRPFSQEHHMHEIEGNKVLASTGKDGHTHKLIWKGWTPPRPKGSLAGGLG
jgi:hypothetical protein